MTDIAQLSEKEREALRLLFAGHDAKSAARELGLSVHAITDRLRSARQKLGVTSSREAARLLAEAEADVDTPQSHVHKPLGDEKTVETGDNTSDAATNDAISARSAWLTRGLPIMTVTAAIAAIVIAVSAGGGAHPEGPQVSVAADAAQDARSAAEARAFLALVDAGDHAASYASAAPKLRSRYGPKLWELGVALKRNKGSVQDRDLLTAQVKAGQSGAAGGLVEILTFRTALMNGILQTERLVMERVDGVWMVADYQVEDAQS